MLYVSDRMKAAKDVDDDDDGEGDEESDSEELVPYMDFWYRSNYVDAVEAFKVSDTKVHLPAYFVFTRLLQCLAASAYTHFVTS